MKAQVFIVIFMMSIVACSTSLGTHQKLLVTPKDQLTQLSEKTIESLFKIALDSTSIPRSVKKNGQLKLVNTRDWTSGFYAGCLWQLYRASKDERLKEAAISWTAFQEKEKRDDHTHDLGFKIYCSFGEGYQLLKEERYKKIIVEASDQLIQRYSEKVGAIRSWDHNADKWEYPVIIDNMMNLEMLFAASHFTGDSTYYHVAWQHADKTLKHHFRKDFSSYHVIDYFPATGKVRKKNTHQGHHHESAWSRGQAWGLYGFTVAYRETKDTRFLDLAKNIAQFIFTHPNLPKDKIPYWDFNAPNIPDEPRDASAAAIAASALLELSQYDLKNKKEYIKWSDEILNVLNSKKYQSNISPFLLKHSVGHKPHNSEVDTPISYADYYYLEALTRRAQLMETGSLGLEEKSRYVYDGE